LDRNVRFEMGRRVKWDEEFRSSGSTEGFSRRAVTRASL